MFDAKNPTPIRAARQANPTISVLTGVEMLIEAWQRGELYVDGETNARLEYIAKDIAAMKKQQAANLAAIDQSAAAYQARKAAH